MRSFCGLYFFLRMMIIFAANLPHYIAGKHFIQVPELPSYSVGVLLLITTLTMALAKPYKKTYMNYLDVLLLSNFTVLCFTLSLSSTWHAMQVIARVLIAVPLVIIISFAVSRWLKCLVRNFNLRSTSLNVEAPQSSVPNTPSASQSVVQPASTMLSLYGTM